MIFGPGDCSAFPRIMKQLDVGRPAMLEFRHGSDGAESACPALDAQRLDGAPCLNQGGTTGQMPCEHWDYLRPNGNGHPSPVSLQVAGSCRAVHLVHPGIRSSNGSRAPLEHPTVHYGHENDSDPARTTSSEP